MTFENAFQSIKKKFESANASKTKDFAVQITLTDDDCRGTLYVEVKNGVLHVEPYNYNDNNSAVTISKTALLAYLGKRASLKKVITEEGALVRGDITKVEVLRNLVSVKKKEICTQKHLKKLLDKACGCGIIKLRYMKIYL